MICAPAPLHIWTYNGDPMRDQNAYIEEMQDGVVEVGRKKS